MPSATVYEAADGFRKRLLLRERAAASAIVRYYGEAWTRIHTDIIKLANEVKALRAAGETVTEGQIMRLERMRAIEAQVQTEMRRYAEYADGEITARMREAIAAGERDAYTITQAAFPRDAGVAVTFYRMPREAVEAYVGFMQDGTPLRKLLEQYVGDAAQALSETLVTGLTAGLNPRQVAREARKQFGMGLTESLRLARTEQLRAYRTATQESYKANGNIVKGWRWLATKDSRTCPACLLMDGTEHSLDEQFVDHPNGRCTATPITKSYAELGIDAPEPQYTPETGREWFERQDRATQRKILGNSTYDAWKDGRFALEDIPHKIQNATWGDSWAPRPLYDLLGESAPIGNYAAWKAAQKGTTP